MFFFLPFSGIEKRYELHYMQIFKLLENDGFNTDSSAKWPRMYISHSGKFSQNTKNFHMENNLDFRNLIVFFFCKFHPEISQVISSGNSSGNYFEISHNHLS